MLFSVIIPAYNAEKHIVECLKSVTHQSSQDYEVVVVDDGSIDATADILDNYAAESAVVRVFHTPNGGPLLARRRAIEAASGEYAVFLDADDCLRVDALEILAKTIDGESHPDLISFRYSRNQDYDRADGLSGALPVGSWRGSEIDVVRERVCAGRINNLAGKAIHLTCFDLSESYDEYAGLSHGEDLFQLLPAVNRCRSAVQIPDVLYWYRPNESSGTARYRSSQLADLVKVNRRLQDYAHVWGGRCLGLAAEGELVQYIYLTRIAVLCNDSTNARRAHLTSIIDAMEEEGVFERSRGVKLRSDLKVLFRSLEHRRLNLLLCEIRMIDQLKKWINIFRAHVLISD